MVAGTKVKVIARVPRASPLSVLVAPSQASHNKRVGTYICMSTETPWAPSPTTGPPPPCLQVFYLLPPCDAYRMALTSLPLASFSPDDEGRLVPVLEEGGEGFSPSLVTWSSVEAEPAGGGTLW